MLKSIDTLTVAYSVCRKYFFCAYNHFYDTVVVKGLNNIPASGPVILAPNHQNAIMDALAAGSTIMPKLTVFMARADISRSPFGAWLYRFLKIIPVYRIRDGFENLMLNTTVFDEAVQVLHNNNALCLMPEGTHGNKRQLQPLVKGTFRIAFLAKEKFPELNLSIIPVGIDYSSYSSFRSRMIVQFGVPIAVSEYMELYKTFPAKALNDLRERTSYELKKVMLHIDCGEYYEQINYFRVLARPATMKLLNLSVHEEWNYFVCDKYFTEKCNLLFEQERSVICNLSNKIDVVKSKIDIIHMPIQIIFEKFPGVSVYIAQAMVLLIFLPLFIIGTILHFWVPLLPNLISRRVEDTQFYSSIKYGFTALCLPIWYIILFCLISIFFGEFYIIILLALSIPVLGCIALHYHKHLIRVLYQFRIKINSNALNILKNEIEVITNELYRL
jgi:1-acyl-sn-glycerol-3-phosphate acyltransferase